MTPRQKAGVASMIVEITEEHRCIVEIEDDEVTVFDGHGGRKHAQHSHHRGATLYDRMAKALEAAKGYAADRFDPEEAAAALLSSSKAGGPT
jgi:hypothetical protein